MLIAHYSHRGITTEQRCKCMRVRLAFHMGFAQYAGSTRSELSGAFEAARQDMRPTPWLSGASYFIRHLLSSHGFPRLLP